MQFLWQSQKNLNMNNGHHASLGFKIYRVEEKREKIWKIPDIANMTGANIKCYTFSPFSQILWHVKKSGYTVIHVVKWMKMRKFKISFR